MKILVADDSNTSLSLITDSLKKTGHDIVVASSGTQAMALNLSEHPDLIILDSTTDVDRFECARKLHAANGQYWVPIIFLNETINDEFITNGIKAGGDCFLAKPFSETILLANVKLMEHIFEIRQQLEDMTGQLDTLPSMDVVTGVYNRAQFDRAVKEKVSHANRRKTMLVLLYLRLDNFKAITDSLGDAIGDDLLKEVSERLQICLRVEDFIARIARDEFAVILTDIDSPDVADVVAKRMINALAPMHHLSGNDVTLTHHLRFTYYHPETSVNVEKEAFMKNAGIRE